MVIADRKAAFAGAGFPISYRVTRCAWSAKKRQTFSAALLRATRHAREPYFEKYHIRSECSSDEVRMRLTEHKMRNVRIQETR